jgi:hypothetical protein
VGHSVINAIPHGNMRDYYMDGGGSRPAAGFAPDETSD